MRNMILSLASAVAIASVAAPASAQVVVSYAPGSNALGNNQIVFESFNTLGAVDNRSNVFNGNVGGQGTRPAGSTGGYLAVGSRANPGQTGSYLLNLPAAAPVLSFLLGTLDSYNSVTLNFVSGASQAFTGSQIIGGGPFTADGRVTYDVASSNPVNFIKSVLFGSSQAAMEIDDVASAAPEPATWLMMILGFGIVGAGLRSRRRRGEFAAA